MQLQQLEDDAGPDNYYSEDFRHILESHKTYLKGLKGTIPFSFETFYAGKHVGDLWGLLDDLGFAKKYHYAIMLINEYLTPFELTAETNVLLVPDFSAVDLLAEVFKTKKTTT